MNKQKLSIKSLLIPAIILGSAAYLFLNNDTDNKKNIILESEDLNFTQKAILKNYLFPNMDIKSVNILYKIITDPTLTSAYRSNIVQQFIKDNY